MFLAIITSRIVLCCYVCVFFFCFFCLEFKFVLAFLQLMWTNTEKNRIRQYISWYVFIYVWIAMSSEDKRAYIKYTHTEHSKHLRQNCQSCSQTSDRRTPKTKKPPHTLNSLQFVSLLFWLWTSEWVGPLLGKQCVYDEYAHMDVQDLFFLWRLVFICLFLESEKEHNRFDFNNSNHKKNGWFAFCCSVWQYYTLSLFRLICLCASSLSLSLVSFICFL